MIRDFFNLIYPQQCASCKSPLLASEKHICANCWAKMPYLNEQLSYENSVSKILSGKTNFKKATSLLKYDKNGIAQNIIHEIKYKGNKQLATFFGEILGKLINPQITDVDFIIPVPLHKRRLRERGYNQSLLICEGVQKTIKKPINKELLSRVIYTSTQTQKNRHDRYDNIQKAFICNTNNLEGKSVLLVDDVITTGATIEACCNSLNNSQVKHIYILSLAVSLNY